MFLDSIFIEKFPLFWIGFKHLQEHLKLSSYWNSIANFSLLSSFSVQCVYIVQLHGVLFNSQQPVLKYFPLFSEWTPARILRHGYVMPVCSNPYIFKVHLSCIPFHYYRCNDYVDKEVGFLVTVWAWRHKHSHLNVWW